MTSKPSVLCVQITSGEFFALTMPAALCHVQTIRRVVDQIERLGRDVDVDYVWR